MKSTRDDLVDMLDFVWARFRGRMSGLGDDEWSWCPSVDDRISLRWRLEHVDHLLTEPRNWTWLGTTPPAAAGTGERSTSGEALAGLTEAFYAWRALLADSNVDLAAPIGAPAGIYGQATRRSFVLHVVDELIHHTAEAALLRDLYASGIQLPARG
jgi:hypothetical protein